MLSSIPTPFSLHVTSIYQKAHDRCNPVLGSKGTESRHDAGPQQFRNKHHSNAFSSRHNERERKNCLCLSLILLCPCAQGIRVVRGFAYSFLDRGTRARTAFETSRGGLRQTLCLKVLIHHTGLSPCFRLDLGRGKKNTWRWCRMSKSLVIIEYLD